ncbi:hypothetical protein OIV83_005594 [Microbotryomycetes sp. JL201]|nr:hypothetical protein OIV83_005594 [Microbotryomycetes sp. JL201]
MTPLRPWLYEASQRYKSKHGADTGKIMTPGGMLKMLKVCKPHNPPSQHGLMWFECCDAERIIDVAIDSAAVSQFNINQSLALSACVGHLINIESFSFAVETPVDLEPRPTRTADERKATGPRVVLVAKAMSYIAPASNVDNLQQAALERFHKCPPLDIRRWMDILEAKSNLKTGGPLVSVPLSQEDSPALETQPPLLTNSRPELASFQKREAQLESSKVDQSTSCTDTNIDATPSADWFRKRKIDQVEPAGHSNESRPDARSPAVEQRGGPSLAVPETVLSADVFRSRKRKLDQEEAVSMKMLPATTTEEKPQPDAQNPNNAVSKSLSDQVPPSAAFFRARKSMPDSTLASGVDAPMTNLTEASHMAGLSLNYFRKRQSMPDAKPVGTMSATATAVSTDDTAVGQTMPFDVGPPTAAMFKSRKQKLGQAQERREQAESTPDAKPSLQVSEARVRVATESAGPAPVSEEDAAISQDTEELAERDPTAAQRRHNSSQPEFGQSLRSTSVVASDAEDVVTETIPTPFLTDKSPAIESRFSADRPAPLRALSNGVAASRRSKAVSQRNHWHDSESMGLTVRLPQKSRRHVVVDFVDWLESIGASDALYRPA